VGDTDFELAMVEKAQSLNSPIWRFVTADREDGQDIVSQVPLLSSGFRHIQYPTILVVSTFDPITLHSIDDSYQAEVFNSLATQAKIGCYPNPVSSSNSTPVNTTSSNTTSSNTTSGSSSGSSPPYVVDPPAYSISIPAPIITAVIAQPPTYTNTVPIALAPAATAAAIALATIVQIPTLTTAIAQINGNKISNFDSNLLFIFV
jgi:hypothetical protein